MQTGWIDQPRESIVLAADSSRYDSAEGTVLCAGWRRRWLFTVCDLPKGRFSEVHISRALLGLAEGVSKFRVAESQTPQEKL